MILEELYCFVDDFCQEFVPQWQQYLLNSGQQERCRKTTLSLSELLTIYCFNPLIIEILSTTIFCMYCKGP